MQININLLLPSSASDDSADRRRAAWMAGAQAGDARAYERLLADSVGLIKAVARHRGVARDHMDDVVQETLITVHRVRHTYDPTRPYHAWLRAIASRRAIDAMRSQGRHGCREMHDNFALEALAAIDDASATTECQQLALSLHAAVARLPPARREAVGHLGFKERSLAGAAARIGRATSALKVNLQRAVKALRRRIHGDD
jgi:RNA polymerase sigma factor (sigma-70 family)